MDKAGYYTIAHALDRIDALEQKLDGLLRAIIGAGEHLERQEG